MRFESKSISAARSLFLTAGLVAGPCATALRAQTFLDTALAGETYRVQGEYAGTIGTKAYGAQVIAWGGGSFEAAMLPGGLPGAGWGKTPTDFKSIKGSTSGTNTVFSGSGFNLIIRAGGAAIEGNGPDGAVKLAKVYRESPTLNWAGPADAVKLFDGTQATFAANWSSGKMVEGKYLSEGSDSKKGYADHTLHLEFRPPFEPLQDNQDRGNSGVYVQGRYECQVLDSFGWMKGSDHGGAESWAGGIYDTRPADFNMSIPPLRWATYDIWLTNAKFNGTTKTTNARITVWFNGVKIQDDVELPGTTPGNFEGESATGGKLALQDHGGPMWYRNIWVVPGKFVPIPTVGVNPGAAHFFPASPQGKHGRYRLALPGTGGASDAESAYAGSSMQDRIGGLGNGSEVENAASAISYDLLGGRIGGSAGRAMSWMVIPAESARK